ncbi:amidase [Rubrivivax sp. RP6-9]|uniref:amidase n=1 Tax=Rubrivivax sp. RP6-9 TaxID=3415750 RepID=UPI003CC64C22
MSFPIDDTVGAWVPHGRFVLAGRPDGPLQGLRFAVKDLFDVAGHATGAGNPAWLATHAVPAVHSAVVAQLTEAGATLMGKVLTDELAYSLHGDNVHYGAPRNARAPLRVTGGSSSGSAAAVAAGLVDFAIGTDTGGSTRVPASYCGLWGLRTTHGAVSASGMVPLHPSFDTVTWLARDATVFARVGAVLLPPQHRVQPAWRRPLVLDDAAALADADFAAPMAQVVGVLQQLLARDAVHVAAAHGSDLAAWRQIYATAGAHEGWATHGAWIRRHQPQFGPAVAARWDAASRIEDAAAAVARAEVVRIRGLVRALLGDDGVAVLPSAASLAPLRDADPAAVDAVRLRTMAITCIAGLAGLPQVSIPMQTPAGVPLGISLLGPAGSDLALIELATRLHAAVC